MWFKVENLKQAACIIAAVEITFFAANALWAATNLIGHVGVVWLSIMILLVSLISIPFQYMLFDGARKNIPEKVYNWIKFSMFVSFPYMVIVFITRIVHGQLYAIVTAFAIGFQLYCISLIGRFHAQMIDATLPSTSTPLVP